MRTRLILIAGLAAGLVACSGDKAPEEEVVAEVAELGSPIAVEAAGGNPAAELASKQIEGDYMRGIVVEISDDRYEGRGPGTAGDEMTRKYLVERMKELGLEPGAADGPVTARRSFIHHSGHAFPTVLAAAAAVDPKHKWARWWHLWKTRGPEIVSVVPLLNGDQVGEVLDIRPGPALGRAIAALREAQVRREVKTAEGAKRWLRKTFARSNV